MAKKKDKDKLEAEVQLTTLVWCDCKSEYQDNHYGRGVRVATPKRRAGTEVPKGACTVCGTIHPLVAKARWIPSKETQ